MEIEIRPLESDLIEPAFALATRVFSAGSTVHRALGIGLEEYRAYLRASFEEMVAEGLSVAAIDAATGDMMGCMIVTDFHGQLTDNSCPPAKFAPLAALTGALCDQYARIGPGEVILVDMGAVSDKAAGMGAYQRMRAAVQNGARAKGYQRVVGELSSAATQHVVLNRLGHKKLAEIQFADFEFGGKRPFQTITDPPSILLTEGEL